MKKTLKWSLVMMLAVVGLTFASCSDDDDNTPTVGTVEDVNGEFTGKMTYTKEAKATEADPTATESQEHTAKYRQYRHGSNHPYHDRTVLPVLHHPFYLRYHHRLLFRAVHP